MRAMWAVSRATSVPAASHRQCDAGSGKGGGVVHPVPDEGDPFSSFLELADDAHLVFREELGPDVIDAELLPDRSCGPHIVPGEHDEVTDSHRT